MTYYDKETNDEISDGWKMLKNYICSFYFIIDFIAVFPYDVIHSRIESNLLVILLPGFKFLKLVKIM